MEAQEDFITRWLHTITITRTDPYPSWRENT